MVLIVLKRYSIRLNPLNSILIGLSRIIGRKRMLITWILQELGSKVPLRKDWVSAGWIRRETDRILKHPILTQLISWSHGYCWIVFAQLIQWVWLSYVMGWEWDWMSIFRLVVHIGLLELYNIVSNSIYFHQVSVYVLIIYGSFCKCLVNWTFGLPF